MTDPESVERKPDRFQRGLFIASLVALFLSVLFWSVAYARPYRIIFDQLGMTELPAITELGLALGGAANLILPALALGLLVFGILGLKRSSSKTLNRFTAFNFILAVLLPWYGHLAFHMPLIELQKKLGGGS